MEEIKIKYTEKADIAGQLKNVIENYIEKNDYNHKIIFVDKNEKTVEDFENLASYKLLNENIKILVKKIKNEKKEIDEILFQINEKIKKYSDQQMSSESTTKLDDENSDT